MMCGFGGFRDRKRTKTNHCVIVLLDDTQLVHELHAHSSGQDLLDVVIKHLNLLETSYFGLKFLRELGADAQPTSSSSSAASHQAVSPSSHHSISTKQRRFESVWLDMDRSALKQLRNTQPMTVYFGVKYYASDPCKLAEEITRYQFFLQCKQDILNGRLLVDFELAVELFALAVQSELGDFDPQRHRDGYVSEFQFAPNQSVELEQRVANYHQTQCRGQVPASAELNFLERVKYLDLYGCQVHPIQYDDGAESSTTSSAAATGNCVSDTYAVGVSPTGVLVLRNRLKVAQYVWPRILKTKCEGRCFLMDVIAPNNQAQAGGNSNNKNRFGFRLVDKEASRRLRWAIEEHKSFYQLLQSTATMRQLNRRQQQLDNGAGSLKLSQRFRNSIRSAIGVPMMQQQQQQRHFDHNQQQARLRSSIKSSGEMQLPPPIHPYTSLVNDVSGGRLAPSVVRTPSRRYNNGSSTPATMASNHNQLPSANGNGLPVEPARPISSGYSHTMSENQRRRALMLMSQWQSQFNSAMPNQQMKSHTLRPSTQSSSSAAAKRLQQSQHLQSGVNPYQEQMMLMMAHAAANPMQQVHLNGADNNVAILPAGQHNIEPSIYRAKSMLGGINQLKPSEQFFSKPIDYSIQRAESPRSTKSALVFGVSGGGGGGGNTHLNNSKRFDPTSGLAKRQQQIYFDNHNGNYPQQQQHQQAYFNGAADMQLQASGGGGGHRANASIGQRRSLSKSTNDNLHLLHAMSVAAAAAAAASSGKPASSHQQQQMLLKTAAPVPPPDYNSSSSLLVVGGGGQMKPQQQVARRRSKTVSSSASMVAPPSDDDDDYYCSRSDCSSLEGASCASDCFGNLQQPLLPPGGGSESSGARHLGQRQRQARLINGQLILATQSAANKLAEEFTGVGLHNRKQRRAGPRAPKPHASDKSLLGRDESPSSIVKNMANKQATPILLSMKAAQQQQQQVAAARSARQDGGERSLQRQRGQVRSGNIGAGAASCNEAAVQLLNLRRQQLGGLGRRGQIGATGAASNGSQQQQQTGASASPTTSSSAASSPASSSAGNSPNTHSNGPQTDKNGPNGNAIKSPRSHLPADSAASSASTATSGYYAGSNNSTGADSDNAIDPNNNTNDNGSYLSKSTSHRMRLYGKQTASAAQSEPATKQRFYLGANDHSSEQIVGKAAAEMSGQNGKRFSPALDQLQSHAPSSLKYVSFDV